MNRVRWWILGAVLGSFAAGITIGLVAPRVFADGGTVSADDTYVAQMVATYGLRADQERSLRLVMQSWRAEEIAILMSAEATQLPAPIHGSLLKARSKLDKRVRKLLDATQLERYEQASRSKDIR